MYHFAVNKRIYWIIILVLLTVTGSSRANDDYDICGSLVEITQMDFPSELKLLLSHNDTDTTDLIVSNLDETTLVAYDYPLASLMSVSPSGKYVLYRTSGLEDNYTAIINAENGTEVLTDLVWSEWIGKEALVTATIENSAVIFTQYSPITGLVERERQIDLPSVPEENSLLFTSDLEAIAYVNQLSSEENGGHAVVFDTMTESTVWTSETQVDPIEFVNTTMWSNDSHQLFIGSDEKNLPAVFDVREVEQVMIDVNTKDQLFDLQLQPNWSLNDTSIAYWNWEQNLRLNIVTLEDYSNSSVCLEVYEPSRIFWSPDEQYIAFWNDVVSHLTILDVKSGDYSELEINQSDFHGWVWIEPQE